MDYPKCVKILNADKWSIFKPFDITEYVMEQIVYITFHYDFSRFSICEIEDIVYDIIDNNSEMALISRSKEIEIYEKSKRTNEDEARLKRATDYAIKTRILWHGLKEKLVEHYTQRMEEETRKRKERKQAKQQKARLYYQQKVKEICAERLNKNVVGIIMSYF